MRKLEPIFGELLKLVPRYQFEKAVNQHQGDRYVKSYTTLHQYITILFSQIKKKDSIRDIVTGLEANESRWYHLELTGVYRSTLSDANNKRSFQIFEDLFYHLFSRRIIGTQNYKKICFAAGQKCYNVMHCNDKNNF
jgi:hypothetical protein